jgi:prolyl oligopeptidase
VCFRIDHTHGSRLVLIADHTHLGAIHTRQLDGEGVVDLWVADQSAPEKWRCIFTNRELPYSLILRQGRIFALSYEQSPNGSLVELDFSGNAIGTVIPERAAMIRQLVVVGDKVFVNYLNRMVPSIESWSLAGRKLGCIDVPLDGTIQLLPAQSENAESIFYTYESLTQPAAIFEYEIYSKRTHLWHRRGLAVALPDCPPHEATYPSRGGVVIPITIASYRHADLKQPRPLIMTSYGGFGVSMTPQFSVLVAIMMELGAIFALPHIRGGGEFGMARRSPPTKSSNRFR